MSSTFESGTRALLEILLHHRPEHVICLRGVVEHMSCASSEGEQQGDVLLLSTTTSAPHCQRSVGISDLGNDVFPQLAFEGLHRGVRVENFRGPQCARSIVLVEPRRDRRRDRTERRQDRVLQLLVRPVQLGDLAEDRVRLFEQLPAFLR